MSAETTNLNVEISTKLHRRLNAVKTARGGTPLYTLVTEALMPFVEKWEKKKEKREKE